MSDDGMRVLAVWSQIFLMIGNLAAIIVFGILHFNLPEGSSGAIYLAAIMFNCFWIGKCGLILGWLYLSKKPELQASAPTQAVA